MDYLTPYTNYSNFTSLFIINYMYFILEYHVLLEVVRIGLDGPIIRVSIDGHNSIKLLFKKIHHSVIPSIRT
jgi:hypothetical protein